MNEKIEDFERGENKTINVQSTEEYLNYIKNYNNIIALFHVNWCGHCHKFLPILDIASSYKIVNKNWIFLKIDCSKYSNICTFLGIQRYPKIKIYKNKQLLFIETPRELGPLLEFLRKLSSNPIIEVKSKKEFFSKYGEFSPLIEILPKYKGKEEDSEFLTCIKKLANNEFIQNFYFGITESKDNIERVVFDYNFNNLNISYIWDGKCQKVSKFLYDNKYPLLSKINTNILKEIAEDLKTIVFVITFKQNQKITNFIFNSFKKLSYENRQYIFGYAYCDEDKDINRYFNIELNNTNEIKLVIYDFNERMYYIHDKTFNIKTNELELFFEMKDIINNINIL